MLDHHRDHFEWNYLEVDLNGLIQMKLEKKYS